MIWYSQTLISMDVVIPAVMYIAFHLVMINYLRRSLAARIIILKGRISYLGSEAIGIDGDTCDVIKQ